MTFTAGAGTRFLAFSTTNPSSGSTTLPGPLSITGGTVTANNPVLSATQTWNNAAITFTGWQLNVTDTASNAASLLMDLQVGGNSVFSVGKTASLSRFVTLGPAVWATGFGANLGNFVFIQQGLNAINLAGTEVRLTSGGTFGWSSSPVNQQIIDTALVRDAANTLAQRNGVNAQTLRVYNTFTDASNYERGMFQWSGNALQIGTQNAGTGNGRAVQFVMGGTSIFYISTGGGLLWNTDNTYDIGSSGANRPRNLILGSYQEMSEMTAPAAPAANSVRIYAEDNGSGKTRLMALFATGAAQQIAIEP